MGVREVSAADVMRSTRRALGIHRDTDGDIDDVLLAAILRRLASFLCPCSRATLLSTTMESLKHLVPIDPKLADRIEDAIEGLTVVGDLLELDQVTTDDSNAKGTWVFAAPPAFVARPSGRVLVSGIVRDEPSALPDTLDKRIVHEGYARWIDPLPAENLPADLLELGLIQRSEPAWTKAPKQQTAQALLNTMSARLAARPPSGEIQDATFIDSDQNIRYYPGRWFIPKGQSGNFVARRPQAYGAPIWGYATLENGRATRFLDFPLKAGRWRGCDEAWWLQMAIDSCRGAPQVYRRRADADGACFDFFSPLPLWAQRRLTMLGRRAAPTGCLISYWLPAREADTEERFLQQSLWLVPDKKTG